MGQIPRCEVIFALFPSAESSRHPAQGFIWIGCDRSTKQLLSLGPSPLMCCVNPTQGELTTVPQDSWDDWVARMSARGTLYRAP